MFGLGVFQLWMVPSDPPLKHWAPLELRVMLRTAPLHTETVPLGPVLTWPKPSPGSDLVQVLMGSDPI